MEEGGKMMILQQFFTHGNNRNSEYKIGTVANEDFGQRHEAFKSLQEPTLFSNKICSLKAPKMI